MKLFNLCVCLSAVLIVGCDPGSPDGTTEFRSSGFSAGLSQSEFNSLSPEKQYQVANKLLGTMFRGVSAEDFFDLSAGTTNLSAKSSARTFLGDTRSKLTTRAGAIITAVDADIDGLDEDGNPTDPATNKYDFDSDSNIENNHRPRQLPLARIKEYPLSQEFLNNWMAYFLANTIMFSPGEEMETADMGDVQNMYRFLVSNLDQDKSVRDIIRSNLPSLARWRVSRSPENHALEAYELYLGLFDTADDSEKGGIACKDIYLTTEAQGYILRQTDFPNTDPQLILESYFITSCNDLYDVISGHPLLMPRVTEVIVNYLMSGRPAADRLRMIDSITASGAATFEDIFLSIIFSREYLMNTERPKSFEENFMPLLDNLKWSPEANDGLVDERIFRFMTPDAQSRLTLNGMGWDSMSLKIGRLPNVPLDGLSFANYHKALREEFLMRDNSYQGGISSAGDGLFYLEDDTLKTTIEALSISEFIDVLFLNAMQRKASAVEATDLEAIYAFRGHITTAATGGDIIRTDRYDEVAAITFDYISRLPEFYYFKAVN